MKNHLSSFLLLVVMGLSIGIHAQNPGSLDLSFDPQAGANDWVGTTSIQADGRIIIGGTFTSYAGTARNYVARLNIDGSLDGSFMVGTGASDEVYTTVVQPDEQGQRIIK